MPAPCMSLAGQQRSWRQAGKATFSNLSVLPEDDKMKDLDLKSKAEQKKASCFPSAHVSKHGGSGHAPAESQTLKVDERLRLARERREEHLKQLASRERGWLAREERAQRFYERHLEERRKKLEEQRQREEKRRNAVEEKRKQRLKEERERYESVVQKTMERSQKAKQRSTQRRVCKAKKNTPAKHRSLSQWEINLINRLQAPTISYLARSRSAVCLSRGEVVHICRRAASCHTMTNSGPQRAGGTSTRGKTIRSGGNGGNQQTSGNKAVSNLERQEMKKPQTHITSVRVDSGTEDKTVSSLTRSRVNLRASPSQECLPPLPEEEDQRDRSAAASLHVDVVCNTQNQENPGSNRPLAAPACSPNAPSRPSAGTTDPEEASRLLLEKRRQARLQREREEEERRQREETERRGREELAQARARYEAEAQCEEKRMKEKEERRKAEEEEKALKQREEEKRIQQQKEEEEERQRLERERRFQKEETERQERKKRLEEIMKRTRKTDAEKKPALSSTPPDENVKPLHKLPPLEDVIKLPGLADEEDMLPTVAFKERRSIRTLTGLEEIQAHQRAEVI